MSQPDEPEPRWDWIATVLVVLATVQQPASLTGDHGLAPRRGGRETGDPRACVTSGIRALPLDVTIHQHDRQTGNASGLQARLT